MAKCRAIFRNTISRDLLLATYAEVSRRRRRWCLSRQTDDGTAGRAGVRGEHCIGDTHNASKTLPLSPTKSVRTKILAEGSTHCFMGSRSV